MIIEQFDYTDFNSDIDAINIYERMKKNNDFSDNIITSYNSRIGSTTKPVTEFLKNMGTNY